MKTTVTESKIFADTGVDIWPIRSSDLIQTETLICRGGTSLLTLMVYRSDLSAFVCDARNIMKKEVMRAFGFSFFLGG